MDNTVVNTMLTHALSCLSIDPPGACTETLLFCVLRMNPVDTPPAMIPGCGAVCVYRRPQEKVPVERSHSIKTLLHI